MCPQSEVPSRTNSALVKAANDIVMVNRPNQMPLRDARSALVDAIAPAKPVRAGSGRTTACEFTVEAMTYSLNPLEMRRHGSDRLQAASSTLSHHC